MVVVVIVVVVVAFIFIIGLPFAVVFCPIHFLVIMIR